MDQVLRKYSLVNVYILVAIFIIFLRKLNTQEMGYSTHKVYCCDFFEFILKGQITLSTRTKIKNIYVCI